MRFRIAALFSILIVLIPFSASATFNGVEDYSESRIVAASSNSNIGSKGWVNYTGYLYSPRIVFTAGHLQDHDAVGPYFVVGPNIEIKNGISAVNVTKILIPTNYKTKNYSNDFAIMILEKPLDNVVTAPLITPDLLSKAIASRSPMKVTGYGGYQDVCALIKQPSPCRFGSEWTSTVPRSIEMTPWNATEIQNKFHQYDAELADHLFFTGPYKSGPCGGDSGGPTTVLLDGTNYYVGTVPTGFWNAYACGQSPGYEGETLGWTAPVYKFLDLIAEAEKYVSEHPYVQPAPQPQVATPSAIPTKSTRTDFRYLTQLAQKWSKSSRVIDTAKKQCTSARDKGFIYKNGKTVSLGSSGSLIKSDLKTTEGFKACLDGFR